jgi:uncharacterized protein HemY
MANLADNENESNVPSDDDEVLDPRVQVTSSILILAFVISHSLLQIELERLNHANEAINHLELQLDVISLLVFVCRISFCF